MESPELPDESDTAACLRYAKLLQRGRGKIGRDFERSLYYFDLAAQAGDVDAMYHLGKCYLKGLGCRRDAHGAVTCFENAAHRGHLGATQRLAECFSKGLGAPQCAELATYWELRAAAQAEASPQA